MRVLRLNGGYTVGSFTNVAAAAQNGRDLIDNHDKHAASASGLRAMATTFYADAGRTLILAAQQTTNYGTNIIKEGAGTSSWAGHQA